LCQNGGHSILSSIGEIKKSRVGGDDSHVVFGQKLPGEKKCETVHCRDASPRFFFSFSFFVSYPECSAFLALFDLPVKVEQNAMKIMGLAV
jgi:hypothetical protein